MAGRTWRPRFAAGSTRLDRAVLGSNMLQLTATARPMAGLTRDSRPTRFAWDSRRRGRAGWCSLIFPPPPCPWAGPSAWPGTISGRTAPCFYDKNGRLTDDPRVVPAGGAIALMGGKANGFKGFAFALWAEALAAMAGGRTNNPRPQRQNFNLLVLDPAALRRSGTLPPRDAPSWRWVKTSRPQPGSDGVRLPGERFLAAIPRRLAPGPGGPPNC